MQEVETSDVRISAGPHLAERIGVDPLGVDARPIPPLDERPGPRAPTNTDARIALSSRSTIQWRQAGHRRQPASHRCGPQDLATSRPRTALRAVQVRPADARSRQPDASPTSVERVLGEDTTRAWRTSRPGKPARRPARARRHRRGQRRLPDGRRPSTTGTPEPRRRYHRFIDAVPPVESRRPPPPSPHCAGPRPPGASPARNCQPPNDSSPPSPVSSTPPAAAATIGR